MLAHCSLAPGSSFISCGHATPTTEVEVQSDFETEVFLDILDMERMVVYVASGLLL